jgi:hypothetical protein
MLDASYLSSTASGMPIQTGVFPGTHMMFSILGEFEA